MYKIIKKNKNGFTLIEILVVIAIIGVLFIGASRMDFSRMSDNQKALMFTNELYSNIENVRNNSLFGKGVGTNLVNPDKGIITISTSNSGSMKVDYYSGTSIIRTESGVNIIPFSSISKITCYNIDYSSSGTLTNIGIVFEGANLSLSGCSLDGGSGSIVDVETKYKNFTNSIRINSVSGVMERL